MKSEYELIKEYMEYEFPLMMDTEPNTIMGFVEDYESGVDSINGLNPSGGYINMMMGYDEDLMCYVQDRLINERWCMRETNGDDCKELEWDCEKCGVKMVEEV